MAGFKSILGNVGKVLLKIFTIGTEVAKVSEPIIDLAFPGIGVLFNKTVDFALIAEGLATAAGAQEGSGAQKLAFVLANIQKDFITYWQAAGITVDATHATAWINAVVAALNAIPAGGIPVVPVVGTYPPAPKP